MDDSNHDYIPPHWLSLEELLEQNAEAERDALNLGEIR